MATQTSVAAGKSSATATWSNTKKPEAGNDIVVTGFVVEWNTTATRIRSIEVTSTGGLSGTAVLEVGASTAGSNGTSTNILVKFVAGATITWKAQVNIQSTFTEAAQTVALAGHAVTSIHPIAGSTAKVALVEAVETTESSVVAAGTLELGSFTHLFKGGFEAASGATLVASSSTVKVSSLAGLAISAATLVGGSTLTIEMETEGMQVSLPTAAVGTLTVNAKNVTLSPPLGGATVGTLNLNNKGAIVGKGFKITKERQLTVTGVITVAGTEAEPTRIESTEAGKAAKLKVVEQEVTGWLNFQDIAVETGVLYLPHGTAVSGDSEAGVTYKLEAKPSGSVGLGMIV